MPTAVACGAGPFIITGPGQRVVAPLAGDRIRAGQDPPADDDPAAGPGPQDDAEDHATAGARADARLGEREAVRVVREAKRTVQKTLEIYEGRMARALASVINVLDPDVIVLGGGLSKIERLYTNVPKRWKAYVFSDHADTPLVQALHGDSSGVRGAAWLW